MSRSSQYAYPRLKNRSGSLPSSFTASPKYDTAVPPGAGCPAGRGRRSWMTPRLLRSAGSGRSRLSAVKASNAAWCCPRLIIDTPARNRACLRQRTAGRHRLRDRQRVLVLAKRRMDVPQRHARPLKAGIQLDRLGQKRDLRGGRFGEQSLDVLLERRQGGIGPRQRRIRHVGRPDAARQPFVDARAGRSAVRVRSIPPTCGRCRGGSSARARSGSAHRARTTR